MTGARGPGRSAAEASGERHRARFAPTSALGLGSAALTAVAANQTWATAEPESGQVAFTTLTDPPQVPLVLALALVVLAAWGVLLVTRGLARRVVGWVGALSAIGALGASVVGRWTLESSLREDFAAQGASAVVDVGPWWWVAVVAAATAAVTASLAALRVGHWPEMGTRYDRPGGSAAAARATPEEVPAEERSSMDLWKSLDEGRDPTA